jgi:peroxiredoxin
MKYKMKLLLYVLMISMPTLVYPQTNLILTGKAPLLKDGTEISITPILPKRLLSKAVTIITHTDNHSFGFSLNVYGAALYYLKGDNGGSLLFLSAGKINVIVTDSILRKITVIDNLVNVEYQTYRAQLDSVSLFRDYGRARVDYDVYMRKKDPDTALAKQKMQKRDSLLLLLHSQLISMSSKWIKRHPDSYINAYILYDQIEYMPEDDLKRVFNSMQAIVKNNIWADELKYRIDSLFIGGKAPGFTQADTSGRLVNMVNFRGKYVLLDFWASWCIPCRGENPNIVKAMQKYRGKNFTVLSISLDEKKENWIAAINHDGLNWTHLSELKGWKNAASVRYCVNSIPANYLIDPNGKIIAKNLSGTELLNTIGKLIRQ